MMEEKLKREMWDKIRAECEELEKLIEWKEMRVRECEEWGSKLDYSEVKGKIEKWREEIREDIENSKRGVELGGEKEYKKKLRYYTELVSDHMDTTGVDKMDRDERKRLFEEWRDYVPVSTWGKEVEIEDREEG